MQQNFSRGKVVEGTYSQKQSKNRVRVGDLSLILMREENSSKNIVFRLIILWNQPH